MMKSASSNEIKAALHNLSPKEILQICMRMSKYKRENKELLTYLLYEADNELQYIENIKVEIDEYFNNLVALNFSNMLKKLRKVIRIANKYIKFSGSKNVEVAVLIHICYQLQPFTRQNSSTALFNLYNRQIIKIAKALAKLEEDLQYDYKNDIAAIQITSI
jgi:transcriptional regulatory protein LevR